MLEKGRDLRYRFKCVPRLVSGSPIVRLSAKTASQSCCCLHGIGSGGAEAGPSGRDSGREMLGAESLGVMNNRPGILTGTILCK